MFQFNDLIRLFLQAARNHIKLFTQITNPLDHSFVHSKQSAFHFSFILLIFLLTIILGVIEPLVIEYLSLQPLNLFTYLLYYFPNNSRIYIHQMAPRVLWTQIDVVFTLDVGSSIAIYLSFLLVKPIAAKYSFAIVDKPSDGRVVQFGKFELTQQLSTKILHFNTRAQPAIQLLLVEYYLVFTCYFTTIVILNGLYRVDFHDLLFWSLIFNLHLAYIIWGIFAPIAFIILLSIYLNLLQTDILKQMVELNAQFNNKNINKKFKIIFKKQRQFHQINSQLGFLCQSFHHYTTYCLPFLSIIFPLYIGLCCYLLNAMLFATVPTLQKYVYSVAFTVVNGFLFCITLQCAKVVKVNGRIMKQMRRYFVNINQASGGVVSARELIKIETHQVSGRLKAFAFRLLGDCRITTKTFNMIFGYISVFFLFVYKNHFNAM